jgi:hypothetical protein
MSYKVLPIGVEWLLLVSRRNARICGISQEEIFRGVRLSLRAEKDL